MTDEENTMWREAYDIYDFNRNLPNSEECWLGFCSSVAKFAERHSWRTDSLAYALSFALFEAVEREVKKRMAAEKEYRRTHPEQISFL